MEVIPLTQSNFKSTIETHRFVIINFGADWCVPCMDFKNTFEEAAKSNADIAFGMLNIDHDADIAAYFHIKQIPCVLTIKDQVIIDGIVGQMPLVALQQLIEQWRNFDNSEINRHFENKTVTT